MLTEAVVEDVKSRTDLAELIASYGVALRRSGSGYMACCPFHGEKTPSFSINSAKGFYHCFGCGESGDAIKFVMKQEGLGFADAVKRLASRCGVEITVKSDPEAAKRKRLYALMTDAAVFYRQCLKKTTEAKIARDYLEKRALPESVQEDFLIGYAPAGAAVMNKWAAKHGWTAEEMDAAGLVARPNRPGDAGYHRFGGRLMFSIRDRQGRVVAFSGRQLVENKNSGKYVNSPETPIFKKSSVLYGFDKAAGEIAKSKRREVICCEGQIDTIRLHMCGFKTAVASQGTAFTEEHARMIKRVADAAVLMYDDDGAGRKATIRTASMLLAMGMPVRVAALPGGADPDSYLRTHRPDELQALIDGAQSITAFQCHVESEKEANPGSIDAVARIAKAVTATIAQCPSPVLRAAMCAEAGKLLSLPAAALAEEAETAATEEAAKPKRASAAGGADEAAPAVLAETAGREAPVPLADGTPPTECEMEFMSFLFSNSGDGELAAQAAELLPGSVYAGNFTREFAAAWATEGGTDEFAGSLGGDRRKWFDRIFIESAKSGESGLAKTEILEDFARKLWCDRLRRLRGALPANDPASDAERMRLTVACRHLAQSPRAQALSIMKRLAYDEKTDG